MEVTCTPRQDKTQMLSGLTASRCQVPIGSNFITMWLEETVRFLQYRTTHSTTNQKTTMARSSRSAATPHHTFRAMRRYLWTPKLSCRWRLA